MHTVEGTTCPPSSEPRRPTWIVHTSGWSGQKTTTCHSVEEAWDAIGSASFGSLYSVSSPTGEDCSDFIPF